MEGFMRSSHYFKTITRILIFAMLHLCWLTSYGLAEMIPTESTIEQLSLDKTDRQRILDLMDRQEVVDELEKYGISKVEATTRINSLSDEEVIEIAGKLDELPAGGFFNLGKSCVKQNGQPVAGDCDSADAGEVLAIIGIIVLVILFFYWVFSRNKAEVDSPSSKEGTVSVPIEEDCDPEIDSCI